MLFIYFSSNSFLISFSKIVTAEPSNKYFDANSLTVGSVYFCTHSCAIVVHAVFPSDSFILLSYSVEYYIWLSLSLNSFDKDGVTTLKSIVMLFPSEKLLIV